jgi:hypothetical protein
MLGSQMSSTTEWLYIYVESDGAFSPDQISFLKFLLLHYSPWRALAFLKRGILYPVGFSYSYILIELE